MGVAGTVLGEGLAMTWPKNFRKVVVVKPGDPRYGEIGTVFGSQDSLWLVAFSDGTSGKYEPKDLYQIREADE